MADSTVLFVQHSDSSFRREYCIEWNNTNEIRGCAVLPTSLFQIHWSPLCMSVAESLSTNRGIHIPPHHLYTTAQGGRDPRSPKLKTPESSTLLVKPLTAGNSNSTSDREAAKPPPINSTQNIKRKEKKICSSFSRVLAESITHKSLIRKSARLA